MKKLYLNLMGGLGNQLFQIAFAYELSEKYSYKILISLANYKNYFRKYSLNQVISPEKLKFTIISEKKIPIYVRFLFSIYRFFQRTYKVISNTKEIPLFIQGLFNKFGLVFSFDRNYLPINLKTFSLRNIYIYGYFQSLKYFPNTASEFKSLVNYNGPSNEEEEMLKKLIKSNIVCCISARLGNDYKKTKDLGFLKVKYYFNAINKINQIIKIDYFLVFTDDLFEAKKVFASINNIVFVTTLNEFQQIRIMKIITYFIISNSSFSWWGSFLSNNEGKVIIAPYRWYLSTLNPSIYYDGIIKVNDL